MTDHRHADGTPIFTEAALEEIYPFELYLRDDAKWTPEEWNELGPNIRQSIRHDYIAALREARVGMEMAWHKGEQDDGDTHGQAYKTC